MPFDITCPRHPDTPTMHLVTEAHAHVDAMHPGEDVQEAYEALHHKFILQEVAQRCRP